MSTKKKQCEYGRKANLSTNSCSDISELEDNAARESKLLRNTRSCQKVAEQLVESPSGHLPQAIDFKLLLFDWVCSLLAGVSVALFSLDV